MPKALVKVWLSVVPNPEEYQVLDYAPDERVKAVNSMLSNEILYQRSLRPLTAGWEESHIEAPNGEVHPQLLYAYVQSRLDQYCAERAGHMATSSDDWSKIGVKLMLHAATPSGGRAGQYYYNDKITRWCRYRLFALRSDTGRPWIIERSIDQRPLTATVEVSIAAEML